MSYANLSVVSFQICPDIAMMNLVPMYIALIAPWTIKRERKVGILLPAIVYFFVIGGRFQSILGELWGQTEGNFQKDVGCFLKVLSIFQVLQGT